MYQVLTSSGWWDNNVMSACCSVSPAFLCSKMSKSRTLVLRHTGPKTHGTTAQPAIHLTIVYGSLFDVMPLTRVAYVCFLLHSYVFFCLLTRSWDVGFLTTEVL